MHWVTQFFSLEKNLILHSVLCKLEKKQWNINSFIRRRVLPQWCIYFICGRYKSSRKIYLKLYKILVQSTVKESGESYTWGEGEKIIIEKFNNLSWDVRWKRWRDYCIMRGQMFENSAELRTYRVKCKTQARKHQREYFIVQYIL